MKKMLNNSWLHLAIATLLLTFLFIQPHLISVNDFSYQKLEENLNKKETFAEKKLQELTIIVSLDAAFENDYQQTTREGISLYVFQNKKPLFWTSRNIEFSNTLSEFKGKNGAVALKNGWYQYLLKKKNNKTYLALILIKHHYRIENKYLQNKFNNNFKISINSTLHLKKINNSFSIKNKAAKVIFYLTPTKEEISITNTNWVFIFLFFTGYLFLISFIVKQSRKSRTLRPQSSFIAILFILTSWFLITYFQLPPLVFNQELFNPSIYAHSSFLPSLGHFLMLSIFLTSIIFHLTTALKNNSLKNKGTAMLFVLIIAILPIVFGDWLEGLVKNSTLIFDTNSISEINTYSFIGLFAAFLLIVSFFILIQSTITGFANHGFKDYQLNTLIIVATIFVLLIGVYFYQIHLIICLWSLGFIIINYFLKKSKNTFYRGVAAVIIAALTLSYGFIHFGEEKTALKKAFLAKKLTKEQDPIAEYLFEEIKQKIENDTLVKNNIANYWENKEKIDAHLHQKYFEGFWNKYEVNIITACQKQDSILIEEENTNVNCVHFFTEKIAEEADNPFDINGSFDFLYSDNGKSSYLAQLKLTTKSTTPNNPWVLFIEFFPKDFSKTEGYPELLLNQKEIENIADYNQYAFAKYKNGKLVNNTGDFNYSLSLAKNLHFDPTGFLQQRFEKYNHLFYQSDKNTVVIISSKEKTIFNYITTFSYLFLIGFLLVLAIALTLRVAPFNWQVAYTDFSTKIQLFIIASIFLSFILFIWGTTYYIRKQYQEKNKHAIAEKVQSVLIELEHKLGSETTLSKAQFDEMTYYLIKFSNVFYTDINLYDKSGILLASSRPEIYDIGLVSHKMEPTAYQQLHFKNKSAFIHQEKIGKLNYLSAYVPFRNENNKILAYMNLPYFAKQNELENELSAFFTALINVYGLLFLITAVIAVFFANYISEPLRMIKNKISALQLGQSYEQIDWESDDEIGSLVLEYNKKVLELEHSAQLLIKSERESAWREMAKQVAHEIKNPLTPMKLSVQMLQRIATDNPKDLTERIDRTAKTLIEQIETLTRIANEFASFAKMPKADEQKIDILPIIETTVDLFSKTTKNIRLINKCSSTIEVVCDKSQISRVFNNLIKNSIQAIPEEIDPKIEVLLQEKENKLLISIKDNGSGIKNNQKDKIFVPNFTTKTTGMGLGLAMVKNIVEAANGEIWFETKANVGTTFFIEFPLAKE